MADKRPEKSDEIKQRDRRNVASHAVMVDDKDIPRFAELGVTYDTTGFWMSFDPLLQGVSTDRLGPKRVQAMFPMRRASVLTAW